MNYLTRNTLNAAALGDVLFCSFAEKEAMGSPGTVIFANRKNEWFTCRFFCDEVSLDEVFSAFPVLKECTFGSIGINSKAPLMWQYVDLGLGNHLIVHTSVYAEFMRVLGSEQAANTKYEIWPECAETVLAAMNGNGIFPTKFTVESGLVVFGTPPTPGEDISQTLTVNCLGHVWFSTKTIKSLET